MNKSLNLPVIDRQQAILNKVRDQVPSINPFLYGTDSYKVSHIKFETTGVKEIYSNFTIRFAKYMQELLGDVFDNQYVVFGMQWMLLRLHTMAQKGFFEKPKDIAIAEMLQVMRPYIGTEDLKHFEALHDLGYIPVVIKTLDEGSVVPVGLPCLTIRNTLPEFEWLPNYLETIISTDTWKQLTIATIGRAFRLISNKYALETTGTTAGVEFQNHDFHVRGASGLESAGINGVGFLLSSCGTDNLAALWAAENFYQSTNVQSLLAGSVSAGEHSVTTSGILTEQQRHEFKVDAITKGISLVEAEKLYTRELLVNRFPTGIFSYVADSFDYFAFLTDVLPSLKDEVMARDGKFVVRGDSGNPVDIICGVDESKYIEISLTDAPDYDSFIEWTTDYICDDLRENTPHGEHGDFENYLDFKWNGKLYNVGIVNFEWNRHDKQYYYLDQYDKYQYKVTEIERTVEHKGTIEHLWDIFGGTVNEQGYKVLDSHIGMIYGDGITVQRSQQILERLKQKGFASTNIVFGVGSYSLNMVSRDHLGIAIKATNTIVDIHGVDVDKPIYKDPATDKSKKSARGLLSVHKDENGKYTLKDMQTRKEEQTGELSVAYMNGQFHKLTTVFEIRDRMWN